uniref:Cytochrome b n=1 Tax=Claviceps purpurea TaxID=5111 RepID=I7J670_CLAPU|nr:apocytochrome b [Claviceps purpurea]
MRILKSHPLLKLANAYLVDHSQPSNISYWWNFGSLLGLCLLIQILTGVFLAMHYNASIAEAFNSTEHIMRDVQNGWIIRYLHANTASAFFFCVYMHLSRGLFYGSYRSPRTLAWVIGTIILILMMATAFLGYLYVLPFGQMSATVITNLLSAIPWIGQDVVEFLWGGFSVNNATLNRFFALHFILPFVLAALAILHLIAVHETAGASNPLGVPGYYDRVPFAPYFIYKDLITIFLFFFILSVFVFFLPNQLGDCENYVVANPMQTPAAIVPELLPFYAILRSIPNKLLGVIAMFAALVSILVLPYSDIGRTKGLQFRPLSKLIFFMFVANFLLLLQLGAKHVESPFIELGQISTAFYFAYFFLLVPSVSILENTLLDIKTYALNNKKKIVLYTVYTLIANRMFKVRLLA